MKRRKLYFGELSNMGFGYHAFHRAVCHGVKGWNFVMSMPLTGEQKEYILSFKNTALTTCSYRYAPEIVYDVVFLGDKCF